MKTQIALLRGVTPTGKNKVPMAPLRSALEAAGLRDVRTYIQSGNVIASTALSPTRLEALVHDVIAAEFGGDIPVLVRPPSYFARVLDDVPFKKADAAKLYFTLLAREPEAVLLDAFLDLDFTPDRLQVAGDMVYMLCATRYSDSKFNNNFIERKLKVNATTRVFNTVAKLVELSAPPPRTHR
jgi:uncharacterized protein (DUF1697 family)